MEDWLSLKNILIGGLGTLLTGLFGLAYSYIKYLNKKIDEKDIKIEHLHNGFREEVKQDIQVLKQDIKLIKMAMGFREEDNNEKPIK